MDVNVKVKQELFELEKPKETKKLIHDVSGSVPVVELSSSDSDDSEDCDDLNDIIDIILGKEGKRSVVPDGVEGGVLKKQRLGNVGVVVPVGFLDPLPPVEQSPVLLPLPPSLPQLSSAGNENATRQNYKQFWKAGDYEGASPGVSDSNTVGMDHVRVHPKFLHSNATSHKWALGAFAELLDNALDEIHSGATYVNIDMLQNKKDGNRMLLIEDNGGGMDPDKMRQCMSLGYSVKSKLANTIGQYGNGFKTSTMRLGADVIVFSRCCGKGGKSPTQSIGLLSYTYLRSTGKEDIVVPMLDYERGRGEWNKMIRLTPDDWNKNVETMVQWSPFSNEADLLRQFNLMKDHGTRIIIYNLWEDDLGMLELDFDTDKHDILLRGVNRDEKNIQMAKKFPNSRHFLTYRHSLRSYASILYLRLAPGFRIILRRKDVEHHNIVNDMMLTQEITYRPQPGSDGIPKDSNMLAIVTIGFVKDAKNHIDVQGFNVYHKNRLIKPFWRLWNAAGSEGRGAIGVLEANFVEPAHDKQGFERTTVLSRLEAKLLQMQKTYWYTYCQKIGYAPRRKEKLDESYRAKNKGIPSSSRRPNSDLDKSYTCSNQSQGEINLGKSDKSLDGKYGNGRMSSKKKNGLKTPGKRSSLSEASSPSSEDNSDDGIQVPLPERRINGSNKKAVIVKKSYEKNGTSTIRSSSNLENSEAWQDCGSSGMHIRASRSLQAKGGDSNENEHSVTHSNTNTIDQLREENHKFRERLKKKEDEISKDLLIDLQHERERCKSLKTQVQEAQQKIEVMNREQESLIDIFLKERNQRDIEEENLRKKLKDASNTIQELMDKVSQMKSPN